MQAIGEIIGRIIDRVAPVRTIMDTDVAVGIDNCSKESPATQEEPSAAGSLAMGENVMQVPVTPGTGGDGRRQSHLLPAMGDE
jgi:hypothetical protein